MSSFQNNGFTITADKIATLLITDVWPVYAHFEVVEFKSYHLGTSCSENL